MSHGTFKTTLGAAGLSLLTSLFPLRDANAHDWDAKFQKMDTNGDGKISRDEHAAGAKAMFEAMDANGDGKVTAAEMDAAAAKMMDERGGEKEQAIRAEKGQKTEPAAADKIKMIDTNGDGALSAEEHAAGSRQMFDKMDADGDGYLTKAEFKAGHAKLMSKAHRGK
jgi:Ca2+-binding EF-hand superfamily protein